MWSNKAPNKLKMKPYRFTVAIYASSAAQGANGNGETDPLK